MKPLYIFDLDGTLANIEHRRHFVEGDVKDWRTFFAECGKDVPIRNVIGTMDRLMKAGADVWIFSGRSDECMWLTKKWLFSWTGLTYRDMETCLVMRQAGDYRADDVLKQEMLDNMLPEDWERLVAVFDDRDRVVNMWRSNGITCFQVAPGNF